MQAQHNWNNDCNLTATAPLSKDKLAKGQLPWYLKQPLQREIPFLQFSSHSRLVLTADLQQLKLLLKRLYLQHSYMLSWRPILGNINFYHCVHGFNMRSAVSLSFQQAHEYSKLMSTQLVANRTSSIAC